MKSKVILNLIQKKLMIVFMNLDDYYCDECYARPHIEEEVENYLVYENVMLPDT